MDACIQARRLRGRREFMLRETEIVAKAGAQLAICPDNSAHLAFKHVAARSPIPWLHIAEEVAKAAVRDGYRHGALLGTRFTMSGPVYPEMFEKHALKISTPPKLTGRSSMTSFSGTRQWNIQ